MSLESRFLRASKLGAALCVALGSIVLAGWLIDLPYLTHLHPSLPTMKANTALIVGSDEALYVSDDKAGAIYRVTRMP